MAVIRDLFATSAGEEGRSRDQAIGDLAAALGYQRVGTRIREILDNDLRAAVRRGIVENTPAGLRLLCRDINQYTRDHLVKMLLSDIATSWIERDTLIRDSARYMGFRRAGAQIKKAFKSAMNSAIRQGLLDYEGTQVRRARS